MSKQLLPKDALEYAALIEIRSCYGCEDVSGVEIELISDPRFSEGWRIAKVYRPKDVGRASPGQMLTITRAVSSAQRRLRDLYGCRYYPRSDHLHL